MNKQPDRSELSKRDLMMQFESIGQNCEFGIVQRAYKAEPLGLLRWASVSFPNLISGLSAKFEGLGAPDAVQIRLANGEYMADETRYKITYHTFVRQGETTPEALHEREHKRLRYLADKLIQDLEEAEKIFVYKKDEPLSEDQIRQLHAALRVFGPNTLLWVAAMDATHSAGTVEWLGEGLLAGRVDHFADPDHVPSTTSVESWTTVCANAWRLHTEKQK
jgi:hypothetical protein